MDPSTLPHPAVQAAIWPVLGALLLLGLGIAGVVKAFLWGRRAWREGVAESIDYGTLAAELARRLDIQATVQAAVSEAVQAHESRERAWREEDRKEWREDLGEVRRKVDRILEHWLDRALERLGNEPATGD